jgi:hypothetical protein
MKKHASILTVDLESKIPALTLIEIVLISLRGQIF